MEEMKRMKEIEIKKQTETYEEETESESGSEEEEEEDKLETEKRPESSEMEKIGSLIKPDHKFHKHPLIFRPGGVAGPSNSLGCRGCWRLIEGPHYACDNERCKYFLHEFCFNLPQSISIHPLHQEHELIMFPGSSPYPAECRVCGKHCKGFRYHCMKCPGFDIDLLCAWVPSTIQTRTHHHQHSNLSLISRPIIFSCDACNVELGNKAFSYMCFTCQYWVHLDCALGPPDDDLRRRMSDNHPLELRNYYINFCKLCEKETIEWYVYGCRKCNRYSHIGCVALATLSLHTCVEPSLMDDTEDSSEETLERISSMRMSLDFNRFFRKELASKREGPLIQHWSHDHQDHLLKFGASTDEVPGFDRRSFKCNGCKWPLMAPFYSCMKCNFFLHIDCVATLPEFLRAYTHNHDSPRRASFKLPPFLENPLKLEMISEESWCSNCNDPHSGFSYKCLKCEYRLDLSCAEIHENIPHPSHQHLLYLLESTLKYPKKCNACGNSVEKKRTAYFCSFCEFYLHIKCASLPERSRHRFDRHELILMFKSAENKLGEYICEICEDENRDPNLWFYGCEECDFAAHVYCVRDQ